MLAYFRIFLADICAVIATHWRHAVSHGYTQV